MNIEAAADCLEALASTHRLSIYRLLVESGVDGLPVGQIRSRLNLPGSTLSHHLSRLVARGLIHQNRESRRLICSCNYAMMDDLILFLTENCCRDSKCCDDEQGFDAVNHSRATSSAGTGDLWP